MLGLVDEKKLIYFGDSSLSLTLSSEGKLTQGILTSQIAELQSKFKIDHFLCLRQVHSAEGLIISGDYQFHTAAHLPEEPGDLIITSKRNVGIGVLTADCLPLVFYDPLKEIVAVAHAGWRGSAQLIAAKVVERMGSSFGSRAQELQVYFGPCAKVCCYEVQASFPSNLPSQFAGSDFVKVRQERHFFDLVAFNHRQLLDVGVKAQNIDLKSNQCTICSDNFCSYRRDPGSNKRQVSFVMLKRSLVSSHRSP